MKCPTCGQPVSELPQERLLRYLENNVNREIRTGLRLKAEEERVNRETMSELGSRRIEGGERRLARWAEWRDWVKNASPKSAGPK